MSNHNFILPMLLALTLSIAGCANSSGSGITSEFKEAYLTNCKATAQVNVSKAEATEYCNCTLGIIMGKFNSDEAAEQFFMDMTMTEMLEFAAPCVD